MVGLGIGYVRWRDLWHWTTHATCTSTLPSTSSSTSSDNKDDDKEIYLNTRKHKKIMIYCEGWWGGILGTNEEKQGCGMDWMSGLLAASVGSSWDTRCWAMTMNRVLTLWNFFHLLYYLSLWCSTFRPAISLFEHGVYLSQIVDRTPNQLRYVNTCDVATTPLSNRRVFVVMLLSFHRTNFAVLSSTTLETLTHRSQSSASCLWNEQGPGPAAIVRSLRQSSRTKIKQRRHTLSQSHLRFKSLKHKTFFVTNKARQLSFSYCFVLN